MEIQPEEIKKILKDKKDLLLDLQNLAYYQMIERNNKYKEKKRKRKEKEKILLTQARLKKLVTYNKDMGIFYWGENQSPKKRNKPIGKIKEGKYQQITIDKRTYPAHRLAWLYVYGYFPENLIDHINRKKHDNRIINLREATHQCNVRNSNVNKNSITGVTGVLWNKSSKCFMAQITVNREHIHLCGTDSFAYAVYRRWEAEKEYNFPNCNTTSSSYLWLKKNGLIKE